MSLGLVAVPEAPLIAPSPVAGVRFVHPVVVVGVDTAMPAEKLEVPLALEAAVRYQ